MTDKIMLPRQLAQFALNAVEYLTLRGDDIGASNAPVAEALRAALAEPVPPAGGEMEDDIGGLISVMRNAVREDANNGGIANFENARAAENDLRAHVTRLQAEMERLKSESFEGLYNAAIDERDALQAEVHEFRTALQVANKNTKQVRAARDALQSELTKARGEPVLQWSDDGMTWMDGKENEMVSARCAGWKTRTLYRHPPDKDQDAPVLFVAQDAISDPEQVGMHATRKANAVQTVPLYAEQPAPVAVVMPELVPTFEAWWESHGQYCRAGGGDYEKTFAYRAYENALAEVARLNPIKQ